MPNANTDWQIVIATPGVIRRSSKQKEKNKSRSREWNVLAARLKLKIRQRLAPHSRIATLPKARLSSTDHDLLASIEEEAPKTTPKSSPPEQTSPPVPKQAKQRRADIRVDTLSSIQITTTPHAA